MCLYINCQFFRKAFLSSANDEPNLAVYRENQLFQRCNRRNYISLNPSVYGSIWRYRGPNAYCKAHIKRASRLIRTFYDCTCKTNFLGERFVKDFEKRRKKLFEKGATLNTLGPHICKTTFYHYSRVFLMLKQTSKTVKQIIKTKSAFNGTLYLKCLKPCRNIVFWIKKS